MCIDKDLRAFDCSAAGAAASGPRMQAGAHAVGDASACGEELRIPPTRSKDWDRQVQPAAALGVQVDEDAGVSKRDKDHDHDHVSG